MTIKRVNGKYRLDVRPNGAKGKRVIKLFGSKAEALQYERQILSGRIEIQGVQPPIDNRQLTELIPVWYDLHGRGLKAGAGTKVRLHNIATYLQNPIARLVTPSVFALYRNSRLDAGLSPTTLNRELSYIQAMYRELKRLAIIDYESPLLHVKKLKESSRELSYLTHEQLHALFIQVQASTNESLPFVVNICLATGARWSEAQGLTFQNCINQGFQFVDTKNGKNRFIPVCKTLFEQVKERLSLSDFKPCYWAYRVAFSRTQLKVSRGQLAHILRHTFASHFIMRGGNVLALQKILGHSSLTVTMRYSHLSPDYLHQAVQFNPLVKIQSGNKVETK